MKRGQWYGYFVGASHEDRVMTIVEDGSTLDWLLDDYRVLRSALAAVVGVDGREELEAMEASLRLTVAPAADKAVLIDAIHVLIASLPAPAEIGS